MRGRDFPFSLPLDSSLRLARSPLLKAIAEDADDETLRCSYTHARVYPMTASFSPSVHPLLWRVFSIVGSTWPMFSPRRALDFTFCQRRVKPASAGIRERRPSVHNVR